MASATVTQPDVRMLPMRRRILRARVITMIVYARSIVASLFFIRPFLLRINGAACIRERKGEMPRIPFLMMLKLKWIWFRGVWCAEAEGHDPKMEEKFNRFIVKVEEYVEAHAKEEAKEYPLPEYDWRNGSPEDFYEKFVKTPQPVVLRGFALQTDAVKKWSFDHVVDLCGDVEVNLTSADSDWLGKLREVRDPKIYCANADAPFKAFPELAEDLSIPKLEPYLKRRNTWNQFFIGQKATGSGYHCAGIWNFFFMVEGQKKWWFVDPELTWTIYPSMITGALAYGSLVSFPWKADLAYYRLYKYCPRFTVTLNPGDVLLNPPWWWHAVDNLTPTSVAVATRWDAMSGDFTFYEINRILSLLAIFNPRFPKFLHDFLLTNVGKGRHVAMAGGGAFEEDDMKIDPRNQKARMANSYHGKIVRKVQLRRKW
jgi:Cupin-like domain